METILITGINGFLGSNLAKRFSKNYRIIGTEFSLENLFRINNYNFLVYESNIDTFNRIFSDNKIDLVIHTATDYGKNNEDNRLLFDSNVVSPFYLLEFVLKYNVDLFINTDSALERYTSAYALTKKQLYDWLYFRSKEINVVNLQLEHFYGPGASKINFITSMISKLVNNEPSIDLTPGEQKRDFVFYEDVIDAYETIVNSRKSLKNQFNHFEIGSGKLISIKELIKMLKKLIGSDSQLNFGALPYRENELMESKTNLESILRLGWKPKTKFKEGLIKTIKEMKK